MSHASQITKPQYVHDNGATIAVLTGDAASQHLNKRRIEAALRAVRGIAVELIEETMEGQHDDKHIIAVCVEDHRKHVALVKTLQEHIAQQDREIQQMRTSAVMARAALIEREEVNSGPAAEAYTQLMGKINSQAAASSAPGAAKAVPMGGIAVLLNCLRCFKRSRA